MLSIEEKSGFALCHTDQHTFCSGPEQTTKTFRTYLNSTQNAILYRNMDEIVAVYPVKCGFTELNGFRPSCDINERYWLFKKWAALFSCFS